MGKGGFSIEGTTLTFDQVFTLVNRGEGKSGEMVFVADVDRYNGGARRVHFEHCHHPEGYQLWVDSMPICLLASWTTNAKNSIWRLERSIWNKHVLNLSLYHYTDIGDTDCLWSGCVFSNRTNTDDVVSFIKRRQISIEKEEDEEK